MIKEKDVTFIITCFKSENIIQKLLKKIPNNFNKIIIENSGNVKMKQLEKKFKNLKCFIMKENLGYGRANNVAIKYSKTKYIFIINPDVNLKTKDISNILKYCQKIKFSIIGFTSSTEKYYFPKDNLFIKTNEVKGFAMFIKKKDIINCLFDEKIFLYLEEIDLCRRVIKKGGSIYVLNYRLNHIGGKSHGNNSKEMEKSRNWHWMWSKFYFKKKYSSYLFSFFYYFPVLALCLIKFLFYSNIKNKKIIYKYRFLGLLNSMIGRNAFYRPKL